MENLIDPMALMLGKGQHYRLIITPPEGPNETLVLDPDTESFEYIPVYYGLHEFQLEAHWRRCELKAGFTGKCSYPVSDYSGVTGVYYRDYGLNGTESGSQKTSSSPSPRSPAGETNSADEAKRKNDEWTEEHTQSSKSSPKSCPANAKPKLFYINGMNTALMSTLAEPEDGVLRQLRRIIELFPDYDVELLYVEHEDLVIDTHEVLDQTFKENCATANTPKGVKEIWTSFWNQVRSPFIDDIRTNPERDDATYCNGKSIEDMHAESHALAWNRTINSQPDLGFHYGVYQELAAREEPYTVIGYSQGSLYAAYGYEAVVTNYPKMEDRIAVFMVGAAASHNPSPIGYDEDPEVVGNHITFKTDLVIAALSAIRNPLPRNFQYQSGVGMNHSFISYFGEKNSIPSSKIVERVNILTGNLPEYTCEEPEPPKIACEQAVRVGGERSATHQINLGNQPGNVKIEFDAFNIPDGLRVRNNKGKQIYSTNGEVSGTHSKDYRFRGTSDGTGEILIADVEANSDPDTAWHLSMFCPGDYVNDKENLYFYYRASKQINNRFRCSIKAWIDGQLVHYTGPNRVSSVSFQAEVRPGRHEYRWEADCASVHSNGSCGAGPDCQTWDDSGIARENSGFSGYMTTLPDPILRSHGTLIFTN